jgi:hypothetical protein
MTMRKLNKRIRIDLLVKIFLRTITWVNFLTLKVYLAVRVVFKEHGTALKLPFYCFKMASDASRWSRQTQGKVRVETTVLCSLELLAGHYQSHAPYRMATVLEMTGSASHVGYFAPG